MMIKNIKIGLVFFVCYVQGCQQVSAQTEEEIWGGASLPVLVMPQRCHVDVEDCPWGSQCRGGICFWSHCLADKTTTVSQGSVANKAWTSAETTPTTTTKSTTKKEPSNSSTTTATNTNTNKTVLQTSSKPVSPCNTGWSDLHEKLPYCYKKGYAAISKLDAIEQCRKMDSLSTLFRYTQAELDSVVLHMNNGDPIDIWTDAYFRNGDWHWGNGSIILLSNNLIDHGQNGDCLYLETMDVLFWGNKEENVVNPYGLDEAIGKLIPTRCTDGTRTLDVVCQTPKNKANNPS